MLVRAKLENKSLVLGYTSVDEACQVIQYGGSCFIIAETGERMTERGRMVQRTFRIVTADIEVKRTLDEEF